MITFHDENKMFVLTLNEDNGCYVIGNQYGDWASGTVSCYEEAYPLLKRFVQCHTVQYHTEDIMGSYVKRVASSPVTREYGQLQALIHPGSASYTVQVYDNEFFLKSEIETSCKTEAEVLDWMREHYTIPFGLLTYVYRAGIGVGFINGGVSSAKNDFMLLTHKSCYLQEATDLQDCMILAHHGDDSDGNYCYPAYKIHRSFMMGGNFLYTSDSRFKEIAGTSYPIPIHDRCKF